MNQASIWQPFLLALPILAIGVSGLLKMRRPKNVNLIRILVVAFGLHFGLMPLYGFFITWMNDNWPFEAQEVFDAYWCLYVFLGGLLTVLAIFDRLPKKFRRGWTIPQLLEKQYSDISMRVATIYFALIIGFLLGYNIYFGYTSYASGTLERNLSVPYSLVVLKSLAGVLVCGLIGYGAIHLIRGKQFWFLGLLMLLSNNLLDPYARRKYMLVVLLLILIKLLIDRFKVKFREVIILGSAGLFILIVFFPFLFVFRQLTIEDPKGKKSNSDLAETYEISQGSRGERLSKGLQDNEAYRANQIARNIEYMRLPGNENNYMNGLLLAFQVSKVVPRALYPTKIESRQLNSPESIVFVYYGKKGFDMTDNFPIYGYLEFGFWGAFILGVIQGSILIIFEWFAFQFQKIQSFLGLSALIYIIYYHLNLEYHYVKELSQLRELILLFLILWPISIVLKYVRKNTTLAAAQ